MPKVNKTCQRFSGQGETEQTQQFFGDRMLYGGLEMTNSAAIGVVPKAFDIRLDLPAFVLGKLTVQQWFCKS